MKRIGILIEDVKNYKEFSNFDFNFEQDIIVLMKY